MLREDTAIWGPSPEQSMSRPLKGAGQRKQKTLGSAKGLKKGGKPIIKINALANKIIFEKIKKYPTQHLCSKVKWERPPALP
jgi:hypothetical protein